MGTVILRVLSSWAETPSNDAYYSIGYDWGEIEEYTIDITFGLPVEMLSFSSNCVEDGVLVTWITASEINTSHFNLQKSRNGFDWNIISTIGAAGNSTQSITYNFTDTNVINGPTYYKLNQFDFNGTYEVFGPISINCLESTSGYFSIFPNPSSNSFSIILDYDVLVGDGVIVITDDMGRYIYSKNVEVMPGINFYDLDRLNITPGIYYISVKNGNYTSGVLKHVIR
jgi:hypothetical protein